MENTQAKMEGYPPQKSAKRLILIMEVSLRFLAFAAAIAATLLMALNRETVNIFGFTLEAKYSDSSAFKFFVVGNAVGSAYALLSIPTAFIMSSKASGGTAHFFLFLFDLMLMGLMVAAASAATAVGYLAKKGNSLIGWEPICGQVNSFCKRAGGSIALSFAALVLYFLIVLLSALKGQANPSFQ